MTNNKRIVTLSNRRLFAFLLLLAAVLLAFATTKATAGVSSDLDMELDDEYNSGIDALMKDDKKEKKQKASAVVDDLGLDNGTTEDNDDETPDEMDYNDDDDDDEESTAGGNKKSKKGGKKGRKAKKDDGVLPELVESADRLNEQSGQLAELAAVFKTEVAELGGLPKKLLETSARLTALAKKPAWQSNAMMFNTQAKKLKEQSRRIQDLLTQLLDRIPEYEKESRQLSDQSETLKGIADQNMLQGTDSDDPSVIELRKEVKSVQKKYAKTLKKSQELTSQLKKLKEQGDQVNQIAASLPDDGEAVAAAAAVKGEKKTPEKEKKTTDKKSTEKKKKKTKSSEL